MEQLTPESEVQHMARDRRTPAAPRTERLQAMVTEKERAILERVAARRGWTTSEYLRASALVCAVVDGEVSAARAVGSAFVEAVRDSVGRSLEEREMTTA